MKEDAVPLRLYAYSGVLYTGNYSGLMIVSTAEGLRTLARQLEEASHKEGEAYSEEWPHMVLEKKAIGPYGNETRFELSFHIEGTKPSEQVVPRIRKFPGKKLGLLILALASVGLVRALDCLGYALVQLWFWLS